MAIARRSLGAWVAGTTSISMTMPTTHVAGDLLLMFIHTCNNAITTPPGNGWQLLSPSPVSTGSANTALGVRLTVYWKIASSSSEASQTISVTSGTATNGITVAYSGVDNTTPFDLTPVSAVAAASTANLSFPTLTTATNGAMIINAVALDNDLNSTSSVTSPVNASLVSPTIAYQQTVNTGTGGGIAFIEGIKTAAGLISATTATVAAAARAYLTIALRPVDIRSGSFSITGGQTVTASVKKGGKTSVSIAVGQTVTTTIKSTRLSAVSISQPTAIAVTGQKQVDTRSGITQIMQSQTVFITIKKIGKGAASISHPGTMTGTGIKKALASVSINQATTIMYTGKKTAKSIASISQLGTLTLFGKKIAQASLQISQSYTLTAVGKKLAKSVAQISQTSSIIVVGIKQGAFESKFGQFLINQAQTIIIAGSKKSSGNATISQVAMLSSNGRKQAVSELGIAQKIDFTTSGRKTAIGVTNIVSIASVLIAGEKLKIFTDEIIAGVRRGTTTLIDITHGHAGVNIKSHGTSTTSKRSTGIFRINNKKKGTVNIND